MKFLRSVIMLVALAVLMGLATPKIANASAPQNSGVVHIVRRGETLAQIASKYDISAADVEKANNLAGPDRLYVGQRLLIPQAANAEAAPIASDAASDEARAGRWIEIDLSRQRLIAHQGNKIVLNTLISSGLPRTPTPVGRFRVRIKIRRQTMSGPGYRLPNVQWVMYFVGNYALHGTYWHHNFGRPMSHGCVNLRNADARLLYNWASYGTPVIVHR